jgi:hypothetical protein
VRMSGRVLRRTGVLATAVLVFLVTATFANQGHARTTKIPGCAPQCLPPGLTQPGNLPAGKYQTRYFFAGQMTLSFAKGWFSDEDSTGEFAASPKKNPDARVIFWEDVYATKASVPGDSQRVGPLRRTSASLLAWLQNNPNLTVSKPRSGKIGTIRARVVDIGVSDGAVNDDPGCPAKACANFLRFPQWGEPYGIAGKSVSRFYLSDVRYGGQRHLFVAVIEAVGRAQLDAFLAPARKLIATVRVPASQG